MRFFIFFYLAWMLAVPAQAASTTKSPNVAGQFYSADPGQLFTDITALKSKTGPVPDDRKVQVLIVPHAGYAYSGGVAAYGYNAVARDQYSTIVILAPSHFFPFEGVSVWPQGGFKTPLGVVDVDEPFAQALIKEDAAFRFLPEVFEQEHALEVQLPFIQSTFSGVKIVPILMGQPLRAYGPYGPEADLGVCERLAKALDKIIGTRQDVLVIASSDMSHHHDYDFAVRMDGGTLEALRREDASALFKGCLTGQMEMCGFVPVTTALLYARLRGLDDAQVLKYANSGDVTGDKTRVVGYSSTIISKKPGSAPLSRAQKGRLLAIARQTVEQFVRTGYAPDFDEKDPRLNQVQGAFVTLKEHGRLRGCIGIFIGEKPLSQTVRDMAVAAASQDPRFAPVTPGELKDIEVEVSVLSVPQQVKDASMIELGKHGVIVSDGAGRQGVFLPQVAAEIGNKEQFLSRLCSEKAELSADCWKDRSVSLYTFTADVF
ncbi:MAG: AmmeMemoRadiSam system protein B [Candidatus Omnitrophota bacterium]|nr:AmmeMemoRadiSam system protein B [Candidatus Omnitrophota bacterium]